METVGELDYVLQALRSGAIEPRRLAEAAGGWPADGRPGFVDYLEANGYLKRPVQQPTPTFAAASTGEWFDPHRSTAPMPPDPSADANGLATTQNGVAAADPFAAPPHITGNRYRLLRLHRTGGLGQVWLARDEHIGRDVAVKVIRPDRPADRANRSRFLQEARMTGRLEHPGIVPLYDLVDSAEGEPPFYAMRFVAGRTLAETVNQYHHDREAGRAGRLDLIALLDKFVALCRAVAFAHSRDVLHRDLKGQNVVLGDFGEVFLLDWGLAQQQDPMVVMETPGSAKEKPAGGQLHPIIGTPAFMAPELAAGGKATGASDIYGLGVILYTILSGKLPFDGATPDEILSKVTQGEPAPPSTANPTAPPALQAICIKAMAREPAARYASAEALAGDVRLWLADEPVTVYREPWTTRAARWGRRHRTSVVAGIAILLTALIALAIGGALIWREKERTKQEYERAEQERQRAEDNFDTARTVIMDTAAQINRVETGQADARLPDLFRRAILDSIIARFDKVATDNPDDRPIQRQQALLHRYAANISRLLNDRGGEKRYAASIRIWEKLVADDAQSYGDRDNLAQTLGDYGTFQKRMGRLKDATITLDRAVQIAEELKDHVPASDYQRTLGVLLVNHADVDYRKGEFAAAEQRCRTAAGLLEQLQNAPIDLQQPVDPILVVIAHLDRGMALRELGREADAIEEHDVAIARLAAIKDKAGRDARHFANGAKLQRGITLARQGLKREEVIKELVGVIESSEKLAEEFPGAASYKEVQVEALNLKAEVETALGRVKPAADDLARSLLVSRGLVDRFGGQPDHLGLRARTFLLLARLARLENKPAEAAKNFDFAIRTYGFAIDGDVKNRIIGDPDNAHYRRGRIEAVNERKALKP
jgi:eukaryotic-like serine/threonine-protein kinase